jgi:hypothetical protein
MSRSFDHMGLILAALIPFALACFALTLIFMHVRPEIFLPSPIVANFLAGIIVGKNVSRRRFIYGTGVAVVGWIAAYFGTAAVYFGLFAPHITRVPGEQRDQGFGLALAFLFFVGVATSPIAGFTSAGQSPRKVPPSGGV